MSKLGKEGQNWHYKSCFKSLKDKKWNSTCPLQNENEPKRGMEAIATESKNGVC